MELPRSSNLKIDSLSRLFDNKSECYKFFWFYAVFTKVLENKKDLTFEELIDEMITEAWYMVTEYHLNLGPRDTLEILVHHIQSISGLQSTAKKDDILKYVRECTDKDVLNMKKTLTNEVPYRLQAPFMSSDVFVDSRKRMIDLINQRSGLIYYFGSLNGLQTHIYIQNDWYDYFQKNQEIVKGWLRYNMIIYLQRRNPSVPGIADKLFPPVQRDLGDAEKFWKVLLKRHPREDIYGEITLDGNKISIDHFIPWSYVAHDEFWNLHPTTRSINSQKGNHLPDWDTYFARFAHMEYFSYEKIYQDEEVRRKFKKCEKKYLNNADIEKRLYREGQSFPSFANELEEIVHPVYQSAMNCGFTPWIYQKSAVFGQPPTRVSAAKSELH